MNPPFDYPNVIPAKAGTQFSVKAAANTKWGPGLHRGGMKRVRPQATAR